VLARIRKSMDEREEGFTLIELLVVMIIIGILAAIAIPVFLNQRQSGYDAAAKSDAHNAALAEESYFTDNQAYITPTAAGAIGTGFTKSGNTIALVVTGFPSGALGVVAAGDSSYKIAAESKSTKIFCYNSSASSQGVYTGTGTGAPTLTSCP
jgi:type IV pilus assembly protein PilA